MKTTKYKSTNQFVRTNAGTNTVSANDEEMDSAKGTLGFFINTIQVSQVQVPIDEPVQEPRYYRDVVNMLQKASEHDTVEFLINTPGGDISGLNALLFGLEVTEASTLATLVGECHSAGSLLALSCDAIQVADNATMLCHAASFGSSGKSPDVHSRVLHIADATAKLMRKAYAGFLTESEVTSLLEGKDYWFDAEQIKERLQIRAKLLEEELAKQQEELEKLTQEPAKKSKGK